MKNIISTFVLSFWLITGTSNAQDITNTLAPNGNFKVKDGETDYLSLSQSTGNLTLFRNLELAGIITKGGVSFLHNYKPSTSVGGNTFVGLNSGNFTMGGGPFSIYDGTTNTAVGENTLHSLTTGNANSAFGFSTLSNNSTGAFNSAFGFWALLNNSTGAFNSAFGVNALIQNSTGYNNSAYGSLALSTNSTGTSNSAFGTSSLNSNSTGYNNSAFGESALYNNQTGMQNTSVGHKSLYLNTFGWQNTAVGDSALYNNTGNYNTAIGYNAGSNVTTGANLTLIGIDANPSSPTAFDQITLGNIYVSSLRCNVQTITSLSDARDKKNITDLSLGLDFITKLKPRQFNWDKRDWYEDNKSDGSKMKEEPTAGFIAQELDEVQTEENAEWLNLVLKDNPEKWEATYGNLLPVMVRAIQELSIKNEQLEIKNEKEITKLTEENLKLKSDLENLMSIKEELTKIESLKEELIQQINELKSVRKEYENKFSSLEN